MIGRLAAPFQDLNVAFLLHGQLGEQTFQHVHRNEPVLSVLRRVAQKLSVPLRSFSSQVQYCGDFYGQTGEGEPYPEGISVEGLLKIISNLPAGISELGCHPGDDEHLESVYRLERKQELKVLCDPRVRTSIVAMGIELRSFLHLPARSVGVMP